MIYAQLTDRKQKVIQYARQFESRKFIMDDALLMKGDIPGPNWSYPIETMFFSAEKGKLH